MCRILIWLTVKPFLKKPLRGDLNGSHSPAIYLSVQTAVRQSSRSSSQAAVQSSDRRLSPRNRSQLPVPSSRGHQTRVSAAATSKNSSSGSPSRTQTPPSRSRTTTNSSSSRTKQVPPSSSNNNNLYCNNINDNNQSHEDIWILNRDLHESNNNGK